MIVLGLDGATLDLIEPWVEAGALPNLAALMEKGRTGLLRSTLPYVTPLAWPSIYTGTNPGKHGLLGFRKRLEGTYDWVLNSSADMMRPAIWDLVARSGLRACSMFVPFTFPARPTNVVTVTGAFGARRFEPRTVHPEHLLRELAGRFDEEKLFALRQQPGVPLEGVVERIVEGVDEQSRLMSHVLENGDFDFAFVVWHDTDRAAHLLWHHSDLPCPDVGSPMHRVYEAVDRGIGRLLETAGDDALVIVCSDHGTFPVRHRVNSHLWLEQQGWLELRKSPGITAVARAGAIWRHIPEPIKNKVSPRARTKLQNKVRTGLVKQNALVEWNNTSVYPQPISAEAFFINRIGREPLGTVGPERIDGLTDELIAALAELSAPDGQRLVDTAYKGTDIYDGPYAKLGPDVVADPVKGVMFVPTNVGDEEMYAVPPRPDFVNGKPTSVGYHQRDGLYVFAGPGVQPGRGATASVMDITPTILRYLDLPTPRDLDGRALTDVFESLSAERWDDHVDVAPRATSETALTPADEAEITRNLNDLGYIE